MKEDKLHKIYRKIRPYMNFPDMYSIDYIVYESNGKIYVKYTTKSNLLNTKGENIPGGVKILSWEEIQERIKNIQHN